MLTPIEIISFYQSEIDHKGYADGKGNFEPWPEDRVEEMIETRRKLIKEQWMAGWKPCDFIYPPPKKGVKWDIENE